jgi:hypothetical protein
MQSYLHAQASAKKFGGTPEDYLPIHEWVDQFKATLGDVRHRAMLHHSKGPWMAQEVFGRFIEIEKKTGGKKKIMVRDIAENHIFEDLGWLPSPADWMACMECKAWMGGRQHKLVSRTDFLGDSNE